MRARHHHGVRDYEARHQEAPRTMVLDNRTRSVGLERDLLPNPPVHICRPLPVHKTRVR